MFKNIKIHEISNQSWSKKPQESPHVIGMIDRFNKVCLSSFFFISKVNSFIFFLFVLFTYLIVKVGYWVASEVVLQKQQTSRVSLVKKLIKVAYVRSSFIFLIHLIILLLSWLYLVSNYLF